MKWMETSCDNYSHVIAKIPSDLVGLPAPVCICRAIFALTIPGIVTTLTQSTPAHSSSPLYATPARAELWGDLSLSIPRTCRCRDRISAEAHRRMRMPARGLYSRLPVTNLHPGQPSTVSAIANSKVRATRHDLGDADGQRLRQASSVADYCTVQYCNPDRGPLFLASWRRGLPFCACSNCLFHLPGLYQVSGSYESTDVPSVLDPSRLPTSHTVGSWQIDVRSHRGLERLWNAASVTVL